MLLFHFGIKRKKMRSLGHFSSFGIACLSFSFLSLEVSFGSLRERERETVDNFPEITRNRKKKRNESWLPSDPRNLSVRRLSLSSHHHFLVLLGFEPTLQKWWRERRIQIKKWTARTYQRLQTISSSIIFFLLFSFLFSSRVQSDASSFL